ncbi:hypothetical protein HAZT_HAZT011451 [Hyalella azteca]|uniref:Uncharacterized protein n=1 Tax=Hyalella azteca TaxID=294128 RepID=A0A6A0H8C4_HYAAZ|nr:hypothetical protein HAZT_HAZT011451 [Hyalella azteca]
MRHGGLMREPHDSAGDAPAGDPPAYDPLAADAPAGNAPAPDASVDDPPASDVNANDTPAGDEPAADAPAADAPAGNAPADDAPTGGTPARDAPVGNTPADDESPVGASDVFPVAVEANSSTNPKMDATLNVIDNFSAKAANKSAANIHDDSLLISNHSNACNISDAGAGGAGGSRRSLEPQEVGEDSATSGVGAETFGICIGASETNGSMDVMDETNESRDVMNEFSESKHGMGETPEARDAMDENPESCDVLDETLGSRDDGSTVAAGKVIKHGQHITVIPKDGIHDAVVPKDFVPDVVVPKGFVPDVVPKGFVPDAVVPKSFVPDTVVPKGFVPDAVVPKGFVPDAVVPEDSMRDVIVNEEFVPDAVVPKDAVQEAFVPQVGTVIPRTSDGFVVATGESLGPAYADGIERSKSRREAFVRSTSNSFSTREDRWPSTLSSGRVSVPPAKNIEKIAELSPPAIEIEATMTKATMAKATVPDAIPNDADCTSSSDGWSEDSGDGSPVYSPTTEPLHTSQCRGFVSPRGDTSSPSLRSPKTSTPTAGASQRLPSSVSPLLPSAWARFKTWVHSTTCCTAYFTGFPIFY